MNLAQVKKYVEGVLKGWFQNKKILDKLSPETNVNYYFKPLQKAYTTTSKILTSLSLM